MKKAVGYIRVSTDEQARDGISLEMQEQRLLHYAQAYDLDMVEIVRDEGLSAKNIKGRPGVQRVLDMCLTGAVEVLVVYKLDRLSRNTMEALDIAERLNEKGVGLRAVVEHIDTQSAIGRLYFTFGAAIGQFERELTGERTKAALAHKKGNNQVYNHAPYGYDVVGGMLVENMAEQAIIQMLRGWRDEDPNLSCLALRLNNLGIPSKKGGKWYPSAIKKILARKS